MNAPLQTLSSRAPRSTAARSSARNGSGYWRGPSRASLIAGSAIRSASASRSRPNWGWMVKSFRDRNGPGSPATTAKSYTGRPSSDRSMPKTSQITPNSNGANSFSTTTATFCSMIRV